MHCKQYQGVIESCNLLHLMNFGISSCCRIDQKFHFTLASSLNCMTSFGENSVLSPLAAMVFNLCPELQPTYDHVYQVMMQSASGHFI